MPLALRAEKRRLQATQQEAPDDADLAQRLEACRVEHNAAKRAQHVQLSSSELLKSNSGMLYWRLTRLRNRMPFQFFQSLRVLQSGRQKKTAGPFSPRTTRLLINIAKSVADPGLREWTRNTRRRSRSPRANEAHLEQQRTRHLPPNPRPPVPASAAEDVDAPRQVGQRRVLRQKKEPRGRYSATFLGVVLWFEV